MRCQSTFITENKVENSSSAWPTAQTTPEQAGRAHRLHRNSTKTWAAIRGCFALSFPARWGFLCLHQQARRDRKYLNSQGSKKVSCPKLHILLAAAHTIPCAAGTFVTGHLLAVIEWPSHYVHCYLWELKKWKEKKRKSIKKRRVIE